MDEGEDNLLRLLGPPPYQIEERHLKRIFANYKPRDITISRLIDAPPWIENAGAGSKLYQLFWQNVPLIIPAETFLVPPQKVTGPISAELDHLGFATPSELAWDTVIWFIGTYFLDPTFNWLADTNTIIYEIPLNWCFEDSIEIHPETFPKIDQRNLFCFLELYALLQCWDHPNRLTPLFIWKDCRGQKVYSKQPNTKRNIRPELGISQPIHAILNQALELWGKILTGKVQIIEDRGTIQQYLSGKIQRYIYTLFKNDAEKRGYLKYWMTHAFDAFSRPAMSMDPDMMSWVLLCDGTIIQPRPDFIRPITDRRLSFGCAIEDEGEDADAMHGEGGDEGGTDAMDQE